MFNFCTLFDSYYLDKGIALYESLEKVCNDFHLYIFCFDAKAKSILQQYELGHATLLEAADLEKEYEILLKLKQERSKAEYCWTCTPVCIEYILQHYDVDNCTYIDADLYFFQSPQVLFDEMKATNANVIITPHRFSSNWKDRYFLKRSGKYCVEFNYFDNSQNAETILSWWREQCFAWCYHLYEKERMGDQKYLEKFPILFQGVHELSYLGGGVAPWNLRQYRLSKQAENKIALQEKATGQEFELVFYHFQNIRYLNFTSVNINSGTQDKQLKNAIYVPYLVHIEDVRSKLKEYGITFSVNKSYASNKLIAYVQKHILQYKVKSLSDIYQLEKLESNRG